MGSLRALQEWCRIQCENYPDVEIKNMTSSFRDGMAFCAIIHKHRPDLIDFDSLSKDNVYENNRLAFEVAESELGIPALLDPDDMVAMKVPDRLSIITYVSQYYNCFSSKGQASAPPSMKRPSGMAHSEPAVKKPVTAVERVVEPKSSPVPGGVLPHRGTLSSTCTACQKHVHLVQRYLAEGRLYHRNCFRCKECSSTLLPGSYRAGSESGSFVCTHHYGNPSANQNGRPDLSQLGGGATAETPPSGRDQAQAFSVRRLSERFSGARGTYTPHALKQEESRALAQEDTSVPEQGRESVPVGGDAAVSGQEVRSEPQQEDKSVSGMEIENASGQEDKSVAEQEERTEPPQENQTGPEQEVTTVTKETHKTVPRQEMVEPQQEVPSVPPNPFDDSDEEEEPRAGVSNGVPHSSQSGAGVGSTSRPVPTPRRIPEPDTPSPRPHPVPKPRGLTAQEVTSREMNGDPVQSSRTSLRPSDRSQSPARKVPPWMALVQSEPRKKPAPPPPPGTATPPRSCSKPALKGEVSVPETPPTSKNPFDDDEGEEVGPGCSKTTPPSTGGGALRPGHPWYGITPDSSPKPKKPLAPRAPPTAAQTHSSPSSTSPSPAVSVESMSSDTSSKSPPEGSACPESPVTKSVSEPSISSPAHSNAASANQMPLPSSRPVPAGPPANTSSAPATPQPNRSVSLRKSRPPPPPRPPSTSSPMAVLFPAESRTPPKPPAPSTQTPKQLAKSSCKENPFNRKSASPSPIPSPQHKSSRGPKPARPPAPGHGFPLIKRKVQSDQYIPVEDIQVEMESIEVQLDELEHRGVEMEQRLRQCEDDDAEEGMLVDWFKLIHEKHLLVRRESELMYTRKQQNLEERQADVEYELRCLLNKPEKDWTDDDRMREQELMQELTTIVEQRNAIVNCLDEDRQREEEEDKMLETMIKNKDFHKEGDSEPKKKGKFKPMKVFKLLGSGGKAEGKSRSPKDKVKSSPPQ
ncbi:MICAL-like protein 1 [Acipenser ruthenus]|uniref:MICAL-like protein 1 n=1 Tax=Acipenser ruthenus TaxID=7906 RepID=UPI0027415A72|nr:MICAL-like protein 1 [Acipenser ruthenus]